MKTSAESPLHAAAAAALRPSRRYRCVSFDLGICTADFLAFESSKICEARGGHVDGAYKGPNAENPTSCSFGGFAERQVNEEDKNDDSGDDLQWANVRLPLRQPAPQSSGYGDGKSDGKGFYRAIPGKETKVRFPRKLASSPIALARQQHSGPIRPHSGPFSGSLTPFTMQSIGAKPNRVPSIIPASHLRRRILGFNACEPMSPEVTCLGRIRNKELNSKFLCDMTDVDGYCVDSQAVEKGRCFDAKNQLCGKRSKGRKKKEKAKRRFASAESKSSSSEHAQTRREKAATLARSLTDLLEDMRRVEKERTHYVPSVPPPNSLLLMRGCRTRNEDMDMGKDEFVREESSVLAPQDEPSLPPPNSLLLMRGCRHRGSFSLPLELLMDGFSKHVQASATPSPGNANWDAYHVKKSKARASRHLSLLDLIDKEERSTYEGASTSQAQHNEAMQGSNVIAPDIDKTAVVKEIEMADKFIEEKLIRKLHQRATLCQRRAFGELSFIEVKRRT